MLVSNRTLVFTLIVVVMACSSDMFAGVGFVMVLVDGAWEQLGDDISHDRGHVGTGSAAVSGDGRGVVVAGALASEAYVNVCSLER